MNPTSFSQSLNRQLRAGVLHRYSTPRESTGQDGGARCCNMHVTCVTRDLKAASSRASCSSSTHTNVLCLDSSLPELVSAVRLLHLAFLTLAWHHMLISQACLDLARRTATQNICKLGCDGFRELLCYMSEAVNDHSHFLTPLLLYVCYASHCELLWDTSHLLCMRTWEVHVFHLSQLCAFLYTLHFGKQKKHRVLHLLRFLLEFQPFVSSWAVSLAY